MTDYTELVKALLCNGTSMNGSCVGKKCGYYADGFCESMKMHNDAAAAIEELQKDKAIANRKLDSVLKKVPKCGEWKRDEKRWGENSIRCSLCGAVIEDEEWGWRNWNYCYHCGAKMEVQE